MTNVDWYTISYPVGSCGIFFMYFISKHENFLHYDIEYSLENYMAVVIKEYYPGINISKLSKLDINGQDPVDVKTTYSNGQTTQALYKTNRWSNTSWRFKEISFLKYIEQFNNSQKNKIIIKPSPHSSYQDKIDNIAIDILQMQKHIMLKCDDWTWVYNRNKNLMLRFTTIDSKAYNYFNKDKSFNGLPIEYYLNLCNFYEQHNCKYVHIDPYKLLKLDENEYNKLLTFIKEKPLTNWKETIIDYVNTLNLQL